MGLVEVENLTYRYPEREVPALDGVDLKLDPGEFVLLLGASGSGKSTLCRSLNGLVPHFYGGRMSGSVRIAGKDTVVTDVHELSLQVGMVFQDPENQLVTESPVAEVAFGLENLGINRLQMKKRVEEVLTTLRLGPLENKRSNELSSGQKQKVALASVLVMHPDVLVLDEPTSQLDPISAEDFLATVRSLNEDLGLAVLLAEHRVERCLHFTDRVLVMEKGKIVFSGAPDEMPAWARYRDWVPLPPITRLFLANNGVETPLTVKQGRDVIRRLANEKGLGPPARVRERDAKKRAPGRKLRSEKSELRLEKPLLKVSGLWHVYDDGTEALKGVDLEISSGEFVGIIGENGSGKSTLVKHFNGLLTPTRGKVALEGRETDGLDVADLARTCGLLGQNPNHQLISDTVKGELSASLDAMEVNPGNREHLTREILEKLELTHLTEENPRDLSCGQRTRVALASVLVYKPAILVLDEPTRGIDQETKIRLARYLKAYNEAGRTVILVTHDLEFAADCCERIVMLGAGKILADADMRTVLSESLFFTTQFNKSFRGRFDGVVTGSDAEAALGVLK